MASNKYSPHAVFIYFVWFFCLFVKTTLKLLDWQICCNSTLHLDPLERDLFYWDLIVVELLFIAYNLRKDYQISIAMKMTRLMLKLYPLKLP